VPADFTVLNSTNLGTRAGWTWLTGWGRVSADLDISTDTKWIVRGQTIQFLDHAVRITDVLPDAIWAQVLYGGNDNDEPIGDVLPLHEGDVVSAGRHEVHVDPAVTWDNIWTWNELEPVIEPWYLELVAIVGDTALVRAGRILQRGETFFVDGAEYDVAAIYTEGPDPDNPFKYITLRNPLPKYEDVVLEPLTIIKTAVQEGQPLPLLPPFNMEHDTIDDVNIPENETNDPDEQEPDNVIGEAEHCGGPLGAVYGCDSGIHRDYNTIQERRLEDLAPVVETFIAEEKEPRFDTNLLEEKFGEFGGFEWWRWINIETLPWDYTEFVLPRQPDIVDTGDYILVSSFMTEDSDDVWHEDADDAVRVKFVYDAEDGTGIYVNSLLCQPVWLRSLTSDSPVSIGHTMHFEAVVTGRPPITYEWDFGGAGTATGEDTATPTFVYDAPGDYTVVFTARNECPSTVTASIDVTVETCFGDFNGDGWRTLADIMLMVPHWNTSCGDPGYDPLYDVDGDCDIDLGDIMQVAAVWNTPCP
jgi:hypothetical protein